MSEMLRMAAALRLASDADLARVITERMLTSTAFVDFFDLAEALTQPKSVSSTLAGLPRSQALAIHRLSQEMPIQPGDQAVLDSLARNFLIERIRDSAGQTTGEYRIYESVAAVLQGLEPALDRPVLAETPDDYHAPAEHDRDAGVAIFETLQALTELHFDLELRFVREVGKRSVGLPDIKRLATHLRKGNDFARAIYEIADLAGLIVLAAGRWQLGANADNWLNWSPGERWRHLLWVWRNILGDESAAELLADIKLFEPRIPNLDLLLKRNYPIADSSVLSRIHRVASMANHIGLTVNGNPTSWLVSALRGEYDSAIELATPHLPATAQRIICQADLSIIAPGPLDTKTEIQLRRFADTEQVGMASTYRLSALSLSHGMETGMTESQIRSLLEELSGKALPQPVDYLIRESANRFGRLTVTEGSSELRSIVSSSDPILLTEIVNDVRLRPFNLKATETGSLASRFEVDLVYYGLRDAGYSAVRVDANAMVISPQVVLTLTSSVKSLSTIADDIARIRTQDAKVSSEPDSNDVLRQIQLALKNKTRLQITVTNSTGSELSYLLEPVGIANGRLRGIDSKADIERTLPLASITQVSLG